MKAKERVYMVVPCIERLPEEEVYVLTNRGLLRRTDPEVCWLSANNIVYYPEYWLEEIPTPVYVFTEDERREDLTDFHKFVIENMLKDMDKSFSSYECQMEEYAKEYIKQNQRA